MLQQTAIATYHAYIYVYNCFFTNNMYYFHTYIGPGGKEDAAAGGHNYYAYTFELLHFNKVPRSIMDDMYLNVTNFVQYT